MNTPSLSQVIVHHRVRTFFAAVLGTIALSLISLTFLSVWLNRTLTNTPTYVDTVTPIASQAAVQNLVAGKIADQLLDSAPTDDLAQMLLTPAQIAGQTGDALKPVLRPVIVTNVKTVLSSPTFTKLWTDTNRSAESQLVTQLASNSSSITLDLHPALVGAVALLKTTPLAQVSDKLDLPADAGVLNLKGGSIDKAHQYYHWFKTGTWTLVILVLVLMVLAVIVSVHHLKTIRRMLVGTAIVSLVLAAILEAPSIVRVKSVDAETLAAAKAIAHVLFHNLQVACIVIAIGCLVLAVGTKIYEHTRKR